MSSWSLVCVSRMGLGLIGYLSTRLFRGLDICIWTRAYQSILLKNECYLISMKLEAPSRDSGSTLNSFVIRSLASSETMAFFQLRFISIARHTLENLPRTIICG